MVLGLGWGVLGAYLLGFVAATLLGLVSLFTGIGSISSDWPLVILVPVMLVPLAFLTGACAGPVAAAAAHFVHGHPARTAAGFLVGAAAPWLYVLVVLQGPQIPSPLTSLVLATSFYCAGIGAIVGRFGQIELGEV